MSDTEQQKTEGAIELNPELVRQRQDTYSSLTDLQGINVFSDEFKENIDSVKEQRNAEEKNLNSSVFIKEINVSDSKDDWLLSQLFYKQEEMILSQNYESTGKELSVMDVGLVVIAVLAVTALYLVIFSNKKTRRKRI